MTEEKVNINVETTDEVRRIAKAMAALQGMTMDEYISQLIVISAKNKKIEVQR